MTMGEKDGAYRDYLAALDELAQLGSWAETQRASSDQASRASVEAAAMARRNVEDAVRAVDRTLTSIRPRVMRAAARAEVPTSGDTPTDPSLRNVHDCEQALRQIEVDLRGVESSWEWADRQHRAAAAASGPPPVVQAPSRPADADLVAEPAAGLSRSVLIAVLVGVLVLVAVILVVVL